MKIYKKKNVLEETKDRLRFLFSEFPDLIINVSGGKDSTVIWQLALEVAREMDLLPLATSFLDQEAEWESTIEMIRYMMYHEDVDPYWYQIPINMSNATSAYEQWLGAWDPEAEDRWMRPKDPISIKENTFGTDRFGIILGNILRKNRPERGANVAGVRAEESPGRMLMLTTSEVYKGVTWGAGSRTGSDHYLFYPLYDWTYTDVWKAIFEHGWRYSRLYDQMYSYGIPVRQMRVSNVHHEQAIGSLFYMQEVEPETWEKLTQRIEGIDMAGKMGEADYMPKSLPYMFSDWAEYRDYLLPRLIDNPEWRKKMRRMFNRHDRLYGEVMGDKMRRMHVNMILTNDHEGVKAGNFEVTARSAMKRRGLVVPKLKELEVP